MVCNTHQLCVGTVRKPNRRANQVDDSCLNTQRKSVQSCELALLQGKLPAIVHLSGPHRHSLLRCLMRALAVLLQQALN
jgi:hypothetical protein